MLTIPQGHTEEVCFPSADGVSTVHGCLWTVPGVPVRAVVQISHGMQEYVGRYAPWALWMAARGFAVCGNDHLGHGGTVGPAGVKGYFGPQDGDKLVLADLRRMTALARERFPGVPLCLLGHSMGSFFARYYAGIYGEELAALLLCGTAGPNPLAGLGIGLARLLGAVRGPTAPSPLMEKLAFGSYCRRIPGAVSGKEWVVSDPDTLAAYEQDPLCAFSFTLGGYRDLLTVLRRVNRQGWAGQLPTALPVLLFAGEEDPVGNYGRGVRTVYQRLRAAGVADVTLRLYPGGRHELLNETPPLREQVYTDVAAWLEERVL